MLTTQVINTKLESKYKNIPASKRGYSDDTVT